MKQAIHTLTIEQQAALLAALKERFLKHMNRHEGLSWNPLQERLQQQPQKLWSLLQMENTAGEPDVIGYDKASDAYLFVDCSTESPLGRRSLCYDQGALENRKKNPPIGSAGGLAQEMGIELLDEEQYRNLQQFGVFDVKSSSWIRTPDSMRLLSGALFGDSRYDRVFIYHNGADSYYASRGFRGLLRV
ncbi:DUF4256 domain-containing protein [Sphaerochaeta globosa]|uniref:DUF4256 domain-containing protein n=1 Tax=Sphaerochaeta globosa (strain ATCC BAA-1886 / DSM 22777 / Buddy) TaxID=158189 RepID=F0RY67_SPHGB|nr:DUF4256 domain-containing protein [Sphaerochaeta globosa]ADY12566.1 hypothetical protein SpiBuddy_0739 [Sphaerochaeta globosa str. Buddy]